MLWGGTLSVHGYPLVFNLSYTQNSPDSSQIVATKGLTPLFGAIRIKRTWWDRLVGRPGRVVPLGSAEFEEVTYDNVDG